MLTGKQRAYLRSLANTLDSIFQVGKEGISESFIAQINDALEARELIKLNVLSNAPAEIDEVAQKLQHACSAEVVQKIGNRIILYRQSKQNRSIILPG